MESTGKVTCMATRVVLGACIMVMRKPGMESHRIRDRLGSHEMRQAKRNLVELGLIRVDARHKVRMSPSPVWMGLRVEKGEGSPYGPGLRLSGDLEVVGLVLDGIIASVLVGLIYRVVSSGIMVDGSMPESISSPPSVDVYVVCLHGPRGVLGLSMYSWAHKGRTAYQTWGYVLINLILVHEFDGGGVKE
ncbi:hypothetical protein L1987_53752 [Smallanthus sonchifolius]|uniref:Uncharacterized protein n=1 Tax=Smallanthus sonchifolius TaxID=185202 RepID=A0ACB9EW39_9ASTR|nr:hypothetical protein L1987_53752 [Smallanthus sonchifolius]